MMIQQITQRLKEANTLLATYRQSDITFEQAIFHPDAAGNDHEHLHRM